MPRTLADRTFYGAAWGMAARLASQSLSFVGMLIAVRVVAPREFGIIATVILVGEFIEIFRDFGTIQALIQRKNLSGTILSSVFWANQILSCGLILLCCLVAPLIARFYQEPLIEPVLRISSVCIAINSLGSVHSAILQREVRFQKVALVGFLGALGATATLVAAALSGAGLWSLVLGWIADCAIATALYWKMAGWRPRMILIWSEVEHLRRFSLNVSGTKLADFLGRNVDNAIVGRFLGFTALGYYQFAYNLILYSAQSISFIVSRVLFAAMSEVQDDPQRFRLAYTRSVSLLSLFIFPIMMGATVVADPFVRVVCGPRWLPAIPLLQVFGPVGLIQAVLLLTMNVYAAKGRTDLMLKVGIATSAISIAAFLAGLPWGIVGVAYAYLAANVLICYPALSPAFGLIGLPMTTFLRLLWPAFGIAAAMTACLWAERKQLDQTGPGIQLAALVFSGAVLYGGMMWLFRPVAARELAVMLRRRSAQESQ